MLKKLLPIVMSILLAAFAVAMIFISGSELDRRKCTGVQIALSDTTSSFVSVGELARELGDLPRRAKMMRLSSINTDSLERFLNSIDKIESARVLKMTNGKVLIEVVPMQPVARVFDSGYSYYINKDGKRISASARYHVDVPVIEGVFNDTSMLVVKYLPLIQRIADDELLNDLITLVKVDRKGNVVLVPAIRGHVIDFGPLTDIDDKFSRLERMYTRVLPHRGWNYYDTISVKWHGQVVATRADKPVKHAPDTITGDDEEVDVATMTVTTEN